MIELRIIDRRRSRSATAAPTFASISQRALERFGPHAEFCAIALQHGHSGSQRLQLGFSSLNDQSVTDAFLDNTLLLVRRGLDLFYLGDELCGYVFGGHAR